jgi:hypothetical protein
MGYTPRIRQALFAFYPSHAAAPKGTAAREHKPQKELDELT